MSTPKERVLNNVRAALNRDGPLPESVAATLKARLASPKPNLQPAITDDLLTLFVHKVESAAGVVTRIKSLDELSDTVAKHVDGHGLGDRLVVAPDPRFESVRWSNRFSVERRAATGDDPISITGAFVGIAETGSVVMLSGPESPTTLNFLPEDHIVVLWENRVVPHIEDAWPKLRAEHPAMPRTVNIVTGPSKTADVEQTLQEGAHGPRRLHIVLIES